MYLIVVDMRDGTSHTFKDTVRPCRDKLIRAARKIAGAVDYIAVFRLISDTQMQFTYSVMPESQTSEERLGDLDTVVRAERRAMIGVALITLGTVALAVSSFWW